MLTFLFSFFCFLLRLLSSISVSIVLKQCQITALPKLIQVSCPKTGFAGVLRESRNETRVSQQLILRCLLPLVSFLDSCCMLLPQSSFLGLRQSVCSLLGDSCLILRQLSPRRSLHPLLLPFDLVPRSHVSRLQPCRAERIDPGLKGGAKRRRISPGARREARHGCSTLAEGQVGASLPGLALPATWPYGPGILRIRPNSYI